MDESEYLTAKQLEELTKVSAATWRYWASVNRGPFSFRLGKRRLWKRTSVLEWLAAQENDDANRPAGIR
jgi:hypothetical protein